MSIEFPCSHCGRPLRTADGMQGQTARCPDCGTETQVPGPFALREPDFDLFSYAVGRTAGPVIALALLSATAIVLNLVSLLLQVMRLGLVDLLRGRQAAQDVAAASTETLVLEGLHIAISLAVIFAAARMRRLKNRTIARAGAVAAMLPLPCLIGVCLMPIWLLSFWAGLWALAVLADPFVRQAFIENSEP